MYSIRIHLKIASKHTQIHGQSSCSSSENVRDMMEGITHYKFPCFLGKKQRGMLKLHDK